jgi:SAM-dependent methyltransferase
VDLFDDPPRKVLEVGCGAGYTLAYLEEVGTEETFGIELDPEAAEEARSKVDHVVVGDVETIDLPYDSESLDGMILGDVLEHLRDPWAALRRLVVCLRPGAQVVASVPNIRFYGTSLPLVLRGRWDYTEAGILDWTHLRFFTRRSLRTLFEGAGLEVISIGSHYGPKRAVFNALTLHLFRDLLAIQHFVKAVKK